MNNYIVKGIKIDERLRDNSFVYEIENKVNHKTLYVDVYFYSVDNKTLKLKDLVKNDEVIDIILGYNPNSYVHLPDSYKTVERSINAVNYNENNIKYVPKKILYTVMKNVHIDDSILKVTAEKKLVEYNLKLLREFLDKDYEKLEEKLIKKGTIVPKDYFEKDKEKEYKRMAVKIKKMYMSNM